MIEFTVPGIPKGKGRPRFSNRGGFVRAYTPKTTQDYEDAIRGCYMEQCGEKLEGALCIEITGRFNPPKSATKSQKALMLAGQIPFTHKPDCDNLAKVVLDALNGIAYEDDRQITRLSVRKEYAEFPEVRVRIKKGDKHT